MEHLGDNKGYWSDLTANTLAGWLGIATWRLTAPAQVRIRQEIETHYNEAVAAHLASGQTESAAHSAALAELGDPEAAGRRFCRQHLTQSEADTIEQMRKSCGFLVPLVGCLLFVVLISSGLPKKEHWPTLAFLFLPCVGFPVLFFALSRKIDVKTYIPLSIAAYLVSVFLLWLMIGMRDGSWIYACIFIFAPAVKGGCYLRIWNKIRKAGNDWDKTPPSREASA